MEFADFNLTEKEIPMTEATPPLIEVLRKHDERDFLRALSEAVLQLLMEHDVEGQIGAGRHERSDVRLTYRYGYRDRELKTRLGSLNLRVPKLRQGSYFPGFLEPRQTSEKALMAVIQEAWINGVSTRRVDDLVQAMGRSGISKSTESKLRKEVDEQVMTSALEALPDDPGTLKAMLIADRVRSKRLEQIIRELQRHRFGRGAETLPNDQLLLGLEDVEQGVAVEEAAAESAAPNRKTERAAKRRANRGSCRPICRGSRPSSTSRTRPVPAAGIGFM